MGRDVTKGPSTLRVHIVPYDFFGGWWGITFFSLGRGEWRRGSICHGECLDSQPADNMS